MTNIKERFLARTQSDEGAASTVEMIIIIALAVFAALALFTYILSPVTDSSEKLGVEIEDGIDSILESKGNRGTMGGMFGDGR